MQISKISVCCFVLFIILFTLLGCAEKNNPDNDTVIETGLNTSINSKNNNDVMYQEYSFEGACASATDIVFARFIKNSPFGEVSLSSKFEFSVTERILGDAPDFIDVYNEEDAYGHYNGMYFDTDHEYILVLYHDTSVYNEFDHYLFVGNLLIDADEPSKSTMYNKPLSNNTDFDLENADRTSLKQYISTFSFNKKVHIPPKTDDLADLVRLSTDVLSVKIGDCVRTGRKTNFKDTEVYKVKVTEVLKGNLSEDSEFMVVFCTGSVTEDDEVIILLDNFENSKSIFSLTAKNAVYKTDKRNNIKELINE